MSYRKVVELSESAKGEQTRSSSMEGSTEIGSGPTTKKTKYPGKVIQSRYMQALEKKPVVKNLAMNQTISIKSQERKRTLEASVRRSVAPGKLHSSFISPLQSSIAESCLLEHFVRPELDISSVRECTAQFPDLPDSKEAIDRQTLLLAYLTAKMESNTNKLRDEAETNLLIVMDEEEKLRKKVQEHKRQLLLRDKGKELNSLLDLQIEALKPIAEIAGRFTDEYRTFATALDTTRHELPVKNIHMQRDAHTFLDEIESCLTETVKLLELNPEQSEKNAEANQLLKRIQDSALMVDLEVRRGLEDLLELSSLVMREGVMIHQNREEERLGMADTTSLYFPKM
ncbi:HAUS augmin-like complex subunit 8 isoform X2 [Erpetoichthys calabaricus]|uniref:HAUS augmin-like complex subunit 8 isoform X2 n=1 Tax=Erpetoichthys calabaricus TaxID=27687 RepID=UPI00109F3F96|nr:HAUS augmin-like complex subunit 8 isoform X2 [Erpetoichthys calabaricus]